MVKLIEVVKDKNSFTLREVFVNPIHVISLRSDEFMKRHLREGKLPEELDHHHEFTKLTLDKGTTGQELVVVGNPPLVESKLNGGKKLLHG